jgi:hypothetical protein
MKKLLTLTCCVGLASLVGAAQQNNNQNQQNKKKGGGTAQPQQHVVTQQTGKKFKTTGTGTGSHVQNFQKPNTGGGSNLNSTKFHKNVTSQSNVTSSASHTTFNKTKNVNVNKNITVNKNFKVQKFNLGNGPNSKYQAVKFNQHYHIAGAQNWKGQKYAVFVNYHPVWQNQWWWSHHYNHIVVVFGAPYYWNSGYWYPAWGYDPGANYYFDGPIYASNPEMDPGQVVANVQSALQQQGYYQGEVDGILGPETRAALAEYQSAQGIEPTGAVDQPTLETLGMA